MQDLLITGSKGLVGSTCVSMWKDKYRIIPLDSSHPQSPVDITDFAQVENVLKKSDAQHVIHLAAFTNVTEAWKQSGDTQGAAFQVNVKGTENIVKACREYGKHLIHVSTAYVFDGKKTELYTEDDPVNPVEWYGKTKALAEEVIMGSNTKWTILRIDQPFRHDPFAKVDTAHRIAQGLIAGTLFPQFTNHFFGPTSIEEFVRVLDWVVRSHSTGLYHASSGEKWNDYDFATTIQQSLHLPGEIKKGDLNEYLKTIDRPYQRNTSMNTKALFTLMDFKPNTITQHLAQLSIGDSLLSNS